MTEVSCSGPANRCPSHLTPPACAASHSPPLPASSPQFWVSQSSKWCEYCKCWLKDTAQSWAVHERGAGHRENVARSECRLPGWLSSPCCPPTCLLVNAALADSRGCLLLAWQPRCTPGGHSLLRASCLPCHARLSDAAGLLLPSPHLTSSHLTTVQSCERCVRRRTERSGISSSWTLQSAKWRTR